MKAAVSPDGDPAVAPLPGTAAVIGLGLIGGSIVRELAARGSRVLAYDVDPGAVRSALAEEAAVSALDDSLAGIAEAEFVILAVPVSAALSLLERLAPHVNPRSIITDAGSTKRAICRHAVDAGLGARFVGSHPFTGDHRSGWAASRSGLFRGAAVFLCPTSISEPGTLEAVRGFWSALGAKCEVIDPVLHDRRVAWLSHLPQVASSALALALRREGLPRSALGPGGRDATRLAASSPEVWSGICLENADNIEDAVAALQHLLSDFSAALSGRDAGDLHAYFSESRAWHGQSDSGDGDR